MVNWWQSGSILGHLEEILGHINHVRTNSLSKKTEICDFLFKALNKTWTAFNDFQGESGRADTSSLTQLLIEELPSNHIEEFLKSRELQNFVEFKPNIMNHDTLRKRRYRPDIEIEPLLQSEVTEEHRQLVNAYENWKESPTNDTKEKLLKKTAQLLYIVRSNIAHGEKTPYGPDLKKVERDEKVSSLVEPVILKLLELIFDKPEQKLVVYGTLTLGAPNENILGEGFWKECKINGGIVVHLGLKYFKWNLSGAEIDAKMFVSNSLPDKLNNIDKFEGGGYQRILITAKVDNYFVIANIYEGK